MSTEHKTHEELHKEIKRLQERIAAMETLQSEHEHLHGQMRALSSVIDAAPASITIHDLEGKFIYANEKTFQFHGYSKEEFFQLKVKDLDDIESSLLFASRVQEILSAGEASFEVKHYRKDRSSFPMSIFAKIVDWNGQKAILSIAEDITERKKAEAALQESRQHFQAIFNSTFHFTGLITPEGILIEANQTALDFVGVKAEDVVHKPFWEAPWWAGDQGRVAQLKEAIRRASQGKVVRYEVELSGSGGQRSVFDFSLKPIFNSLGNVVFIVPEGGDIAQRKKAEDALRENARKFSSLFESMSEMVVLHELVFGDQGEAVNYRILDCNDAFTKITGIKKESVIGKLATEVYQTETAPFLKEYSRVATTGEPCEFTTYFSPMNKHFSVSAVSPKQHQFATITMDVTERKKAEEERNKHLHELEVFYKASLGREERVIELKKKIDVLKEELEKCKKNAST